MVLSLVEASAMQINIALAKLSLTEQHKNVSVCDMCLTPTIVCTLFTLGSLFIVD